MAVLVDLQMPEEEESALERVFRKPWYCRAAQRIGLQTKLTAAFMFLMVLTLASYGFVSLQDTRGKLKDGLTTEARQASAMLALLAADLPPNTPAAELHDIVGPFVKSGRDILFITLLDAAGRPLVTETRSGMPVAAGDDGVAGLKVGTQERANDAVWGRHLVSTSAVVRSGGAASGYVRVGVSLNQYASQVADTTMAGARVGLALILLSVPTSWLIVRRIFLPIRSLVTAAGRIAAGEFGTRVEIQRADLIGDLARAFNHMVHTISRQQVALRDANLKLHEANRDLEGKIDQRTAQLETANKCLSNEIAEKEDFLRAISHDLNAPLRNISGMVTMLQTKKKEQLDDDARHRLDRIKKNVEVETDLINELLELSRIKTRRGALETIDLEQMVWDLRGVFENDLRTRDIQLVVDTVLPPLHGERARVRQIFQNLIDNAIKYMGDNARREIHVGCNLRASEAEFYVRDTGQGIDAEDVGKVFFVFRRGKNGASQAVGGKGIGLASVKSIVETYSGKIWVESVLHEGSTFRFTINGQYVPAMGGKTSHNATEAEPLAA